MSVRYRHDKGTMFVTFQEHGRGMTAIIYTHWTIAAIQNHLRELRELML
jgi:hypothetical protein